ncbi:MAG: tetratricopeptide repeat protein, partial [Actinomycetota bacterium]|nr:tetratricopeptide repeat protein [Actinomycetota bacterium]
TRLAAELCRDLQEQGAVAGFLEPKASSERIRGLIAVRGPLLVAVDEAQARLEQVADLLAALAGTGREAPTRVLLVARRGGDWWDESLPAHLDDEPDAQLALEAAEMRELGPVDEAVEGREEAFRAAAEALAEPLGRRADDPPLPDLSQPVFESIFFVHLAALGALEGETERLSGEVLPSDLLDLALTREARHWRLTARAAGLQLEPVVLERAVAVATLATADSESEAASALTAVPDLADAPQHVLRRVGRWLRDLYPPPLAQSGSDATAGAARLRPLAPDLLGEALVASVLEAVPELASRLLARSTPPGAKRALTVLTQAARRHPAAARALRAALSDQLEGLWSVAVEVGQETGDPIGRLLAEALDRTPRPALAVEIADALREHSVALRELAVAATKQALDDAREQDDGVERDWRVADLLNNLSIRLADLGRREDALAAIEEAVESYRRLAEARPEAFGPDLAMSLNNLSNRLADLGRREDALAAIEEAVEIHRRLAEARPEAFGPDLARSLNNLSIRLGSLGRREDALAAIEEAVEIRRRLAEARPEAFGPDLAASINNLSARLADLGRREDALAAIEEAVESYRRLAEARPEAFEPDLARSLNNLSTRLGDLGRREDALAAVEEAVEIRRRLAEARPEAFLPDLLASLGTLADLLDAVGREADAARVWEEASQTEARLSHA